MIRKALEVLGWGIVVVFVAVATIELILMQFDSVHITTGEWALLAIGFLVAVFSHRREDLLTQHLLH